MDDVNVVGVGNVVTVVVMPITDVSTGAINNNSNAAAELRCEC